MARSQRRISAGAPRGTLARPLDALVFLLPMIVFYEWASLTRQDRVIAFDLLQRFFELFGHVGMWAPGLAVIVILLATHVASGERWSVHWSRVGWMYVESVVLSLPLLLLNWTAPLAAIGVRFPPAVDQMALGIGAGIYEELVFRLVLISGVLMIGVDLARRERRSVAVVAVVLSALAFAAHHHAPFGTEPFSAFRFVFRAVAGVYLAAIFWYRGYASAAGCHAAYNVALVGLGSVVS